MPKIDEKNEQFWKEKFLKRFKDFPMICKGCEKYSEECDTMDMCIFIRNKINGDKINGEELVKISERKWRTKP